MLYIFASRATNLTFPLLALCKSFRRSSPLVATAAIEHEYHNHWIIDNLPSAMVVNNENLMYTEFAGGWPIGFTGVDKKHYVFNHVKLIIEHHQVESIPGEQGYRIVGFYVEPISVKHRYVDGWEWDGISVEGRSRPLQTCSNSNWLSTDQVSELQVVAENEVRIDNSKV